MSIRPEALVEPIPGYRLLERIGGGGFGEVWKAEAPGGLLKAIKFVHGTLHGNHSEDGLVHQELKALGRVKTVRHPYILSLERYDIIDGRLLIVMELADRSLWDRFKECRAEGRPGIPREELLRYLEETAEALDLMNIHYQLQHLDIKPQNLFLVHNHVKVADFGLVKDLEGLSGKVSGGVTPVYASPETFEGIISRSCDQYSLAIVYQELLTGERPFNGGNVRQLLLQHTTGTPNLAPLPESDRGPIARALSKKPEARFPTCAELVQLLRHGDGAGGEAQVSARPPMAMETPPVVRLSPTRVSDRPLPPPAPPAMTIPPVAAPSATVSKKALTAALAQGKPTPSPREEITGGGVLFPALVIGLGGLGLQILRELRANLHDRCGPSDLLPQLRLLAIDTDPDAVTRATDGPPNSALEESEIVTARLNKPGHYLKIVRNRAILDSWLNLATVCASSAGSVWWTITAP
jgi:serine/threonine protein kinase